ncbi:MAG: CheR family methyltransferase [Archangium sp.]|nr:CheR family methyltransferase [Archangium sp.]
MNDVVSEPERARAPSVAPLVVGVGASAGGLEPITALLRGLPVDAPIGLVVLQHLDPAHESNLPELLARHTPMKVVLATEGALVEAGQVFVIPPASDLRISGGRLQLVPRTLGQAHLPIDDFFDSLARDRGRGAAGVVLSGTGADGAQGVCALRRVGATTFAQDRGAQHTGMPSAAVATGCVDHVLSPPEIAERLVEQTEDAVVDARPESETLQQVFALLRRASGIDFSSYKPSTLRRRIQRRAALGHHASIEAYVATLRDDAGELSALAEDMLIHVTAFFRDAGAFAALTTTVLPKLLAEKAAGEQFRVWVPGCSTGEEVYSLVIALAELLSDSGKDLPIKVFGTDLSEKAIDRARAGVYPQSIESQVSPGRLQRFFVRTEGGYQIRKDVRDLCVFARQDITRDPPFSNIDLVSCRNLMIYLAAPVQRRVVPIFHYALRVGGVLLLGASESPGSHPGFEPIDASHRIYRRTTQTPRAELVMGEYPRWPAAPLVARPLPPPASHIDVQREADRAVLATHAPPGVVVTDDLVIVQFRGQTGAYLEPVPGTATLDLLRLAREELRVDLRAVLEHARQSSTTTRSEVRPLRAGDSQRRVSLEVIPLLPPAVPERHFIVLFHEETPVPVAAAVLTPGDAQSAQRAVEDNLRSELASTRAYLQSVIEQLEAGNEELRAANEEVVSSNEELQSTNEEMQTAREELQATNEELSTVNDEMVQRNTEAMRINDDLTNVLNSVGIAILILGRDSRVRRFTPAAAKLLNLIAGDVGRPISDIKSNLQVPELLQLVSEVLEHLAPLEHTITDEAGRWYQLTVRPYLTTDRKVDGTVLTIVDIDLVQKSQRLLAEARDYAEGIVDTVREPLLVLDERRKVRSANRSFHRKFQTTREELEGKAFDQLGEPRWVPPVLLAALDRLASSPLGEEARLEDTPSLFAGRSMLVSGRPLLRGGDPPWVLLAFEDLTEQMRSDAAVRRSERALREMLGAASEAILIAAGNGLITYANEMAARTFGYRIEELVGLPIEHLVPEDRRDVHVKDRENFQASPVAGVMGTNREVKGRRKDGTRFPAEVGLSVMEGEQGPQVVAFISDVTARRESEARISAYKKNLQEMAFDAALVEERERRKLAADLHDNIGQTLALAQLRLKAAQGKVEGDPARDLAEGIRLIGVALTDTRELTFELSPPVLYDLGLPAAVAWLGDQLEAQHHLHVTVEADQPFEKVEDETAALLFRAVRELLTNVIKHAKTPNARVALHRRDSTLTVTVEDHGTGFDPARLKNYEAAKGFGLFSVREQMTRLGGTFEATSSPAQGTKIVLQVPLIERRPVQPAAGETR